MGGSLQRFYVSLLLVSMYSVFIFPPKIELMLHVFFKWNSLHIVRVIRIESLPPIFPVVESVCSFQVLELIWYLLSAIVNTSVWWLRSSICTVCVRTVNFFTKLHTVTFSVAILTIKVNCTIWGGLPRLALSFFQTVREELVTKFI